MLTRVKHKRGRAGWVILKIPSTVYREIAAHDSGGELTLFDAKFDTINDTKSDTINDTTNPVSMYVKNTTTYKNNNIPVDWQDLDLSSLKSENFSESHLTQIYREYVDKPDLALPVQIIQNSIDEMAFDLKHNNAKAGFRSPPAVLLTSILKKGRPYSTKTPDKYISPQEEAMQNYHTSQAIQQKRQQDLESQIVEAEYNTWKNNLRREQDLVYQGKPWQEQPSIAL